MIYTFTSIVPHLTLDFMHFDRCIWKTQDENLARQAREHPLIGRDFFDATPDLPVTKKRVQNQEKNENKLSKMSIKKLKELCVINSVLPDGNKDILVERLGNLKEVKWDIQKSSTPILEMSNMAYMRKKRIQRHLTKKIGA